MCGLDISKIYAYETFTCIKDDLVVFLWLLLSYVWEIFVVVVILCLGNLA